MLWLHLMTLTLVLEETAMIPIHLSRLLMLYICSTLTMGGFELRFAEQHMVFKLHGPEIQMIA